MVEHEAEAGDFEGAVDRANEALDYDEDNAEIIKERDAWMKKIEALKLKAQGEKEMADGDFAKATEMLLDALHADPTNKEIAAEEQVAEKKKQVEDPKRQADQMMVGDYAEAAKTYGAAAALDPDDASLRS